MWASRGRLGLHRVICHRHDNKVVSHSITCRYRCISSFRILFCGSDEFSITTLKQLHHELKNDAHLVESIDVLCRRAKLAGRGMKNVKDGTVICILPVKTAAAALQLPVHEISSFSEWVMPERKRPINLVVAVSFGLFIPSRVLANVEYGGLNIHPSLLPDLYGPAPLQHTLLQGRKTTGITVQELSHTSFDGGRILAQESMPVPLDGECSFKQLRDSLALRGAQMLVETLRNHDFEAKKAGITTPALTSPTTTLHARKLKPIDRHVEWNSWTADSVLRTQRAIGPVWSFLKLKTDEKAQIRCQWHNLRRLATDTIDSLQPTYVQDSIFCITEEKNGVSSTNSVCVKTSDNVFLQPEAVTIEGRPRFEEPGAILRVISRK